MEKIASEITRPDSKTPREMVLRDFVRYSRRATRGLASAAEAEGRTVVERMVQVGRLTPEEGAKVLSTLLSRMERSRKVFEDRVSKSIQKASSRLEEIATHELDKLSKKATNLESKIDELYQNKS